MGPGVSHLGVSPSFTTGSLCDFDEVNQLLSLCPSLCKIGITNFPTRRVGGLTHLELSVESICTKRKPSTSDSCQCDYFVASGKRWRLFLCRWPCCLGGRTRWMLLSFCLPFCPSFFFSLPLFNLKQLHFISHLLWVRHFVL